MNSDQLIKALKNSKLFKSIPIEEAKREWKNAKRRMTNVREGNIK